MKEKENEKAERIMRIYNWIRFSLLVILIVLLYIGLRNAQ